MKKAASATTKTATPASRAAAGKPAARLAAKTGARTVAKTGAKQAAAKAAATPAPEHGSGRVQMVDVARMAGVSTATVSRALSGNSSIPEGTRQRIAEIARAIGYKVNPIAASFRKGQTNTVGLVVLVADEQPISDPFILGLIGHIADALNSHGLSLLLNRVREDQQATIESLVSSGQVAGLLVVGQAEHHPLLNTLADGGLPMVVWGGSLPDTRYALVGGDNPKGGFLATTLLLEKGARRILYLGDTRYPEGKLRLAGYQKALKKWGIAPERALQCNCRLSAPEIDRKLRQLLDEGIQFDGVFVSSDVGAMSVISSLGRLNIAVPQQIRVVGYDNIVTAAYTHPTLSTIEQPIDQAARAMVELLRDIIDGGPVRSVMLPTVLVERDSTR